MGAKVVNLKTKKRSLIGKREFIVIFLAVIFTTLGIRASDQFVGIKSEEEAEATCPEGMVEVVYSKGDFCIDKYEASVGSECLYPDPQSIKESRDNLDHPGCKPVSIAGQDPWRNISQDQAARACAKAGKRLASNEEWQQASQGTPDNDGPWTGEDCQVKNNWSSQPGPSGTAKKCVSSFGAFDMIGNVWEWVEGVVEDGSFENKKLPETGYIDSSKGGGLPGLTNPDKPNPDYNNDYFWLKTKGLRGMVRGGYWNNESDAGVYSLYVVTPPSSAEPGIGFRCVK